VETRDVTAPLTWPIVMSPDTLQGVAEASDGVSTPAQLLSGGRPEYSAALRSAGIGGSVEVRFTIGSNGEVFDVRSTTGPPQLRSISEAAVRQWRYQAARVGSRPVETQTSVHFYFDPLAKIAPQ
jgi:TonB family protein